MQLVKVASREISVLSLHKSKPVFTVQRRCPSTSGKTCSIKLLAFIMGRGGGSKQPVPLKLMCKLKWLLFTVKEHQKNKLPNNNTCHNWQEFCQLVTNTNCCNQRQSWVFWHLGHLITITIPNKNYKLSRNHYHLLNFDFIRPHNLKIA